MSDPPGRTHRYLSQTPLYAFGYGLGYTERTYSNLALSAATLSSSADQSVKVAVSVAVGCAAGSAGPAGDEVVQMYVALQPPGGSNKGKQSIPLRELKTFASDTQGHRLRSDVHRNEERGAEWKRERGRQETNGK